MSKYKAQFKLEVIQYYLSGRGGYRDTGHRYAVGHSTVRKWVAAYRYHGIASTQAKFSCYTARFKELVLKHMAEHGLSVSETAAKFDIRNRSAIVMWQKAYTQGGLEALENRKRGRRPAMSKKPKADKDVNMNPAGTKPTYEQLEEQLAYLRMENDYLKKLDALVRQRKAQAQLIKRP